MRSPEPITICDIPASVIRTVAATVTDVMGGGSISPEPAALINEATNTYIIKSSSMGNDFSSSTTTTTSSATTTTTPADQNTLTTAAKHNIDSLTRIQNYLFKSINTNNPVDTNNPTSNNTLKPFHNENNDAGSFDNTAFNDSSDSLYIPQEIEFQKMEMDLDAVENSNRSQQKPTKYFTKSDEGYYQYSLTSPNNPFLPEIIAEENDVNRYIDWLEENETKCQKMLEDCDKLSPTNSINFGSKGSKSRNNSRGSSSEKLLMMSLSRSCSGEKSDDSLSGSKHKRKLFSQNSPQTSNTSRVVNPFFCKNSTSSSNDSAPSTASDLLAKREEFLKATMKICLVVSPPVGKLQVNIACLSYIVSIQ